MKKVRRVLLLSMGLALMALIGLCGAGAAAPADPAAEAIAAAGQSSDCSCKDDLSCSEACSPLAGSWIASLWPKEYGGDVTAASKPDGKDGKNTDGKDGKNTDGIDKKVRPTLKTFKFVPVNDKCDRFAVNAQALTRPQRVIRAFPEVTDLTEFVGIACQADSKKKEVNFTAIGFGVERGAEEDKTIFIAVLSGTVKLSDEWGKDGKYSADAEKDSGYKCKCCKDSCKDSTCGCRTGDYTKQHDHPGKCCCCKEGCKYNDCECKSGKYGKDYGKDQGKDSGKDQGKDYGKDDDWQKRDEEPEKLEAELTVAFFDAANQDENGDGFPDKDAEPIVRLAFKAEFKRVQLLPQYEPPKETSKPTPVAAAQ